jgi:hypothetical protein
MKPQKSTMTSNSFVHIAYFPVQLLKNLIVFLLDSIILFFETLKYPFTPPKETTQESPEVTILLKEVKDKLSSIEATVSPQLTQILTAVSTCKKRLTPKRTSPKVGKMGSPLTVRPPMTPGRLTLLSNIRNTPSRAKTFKSPKMTKQPSSLQTALLARLAQMQSVNQSPPESPETPSHA